MESTTQGRSQGRVPGVLETPLLGYENEYLLKRKNVPEPPLEIPRDQIFVFKEEQKKINPLNTVTH